MIFKSIYKTKISDIGKNNYIRNSGILEALETAATYHSDSVGYGPNDIESRGKTWVILDWKINVLKRPKYGQTLEISTWGREMKKASTYRDFEMRDENGGLCVIGTSKWALVNIDTGRIAKIDEEIADLYKVEKNHVFNEIELDKIKIPDNFEKEMEYKIPRKDIDLNGHVHNLCYLDIAYETLPEEIYDKRPFDYFRIQYKKEIKLNEIIKCKYSFYNDEYVVVIYNEDCSIVHAIITLK